MGEYGVLTYSHFSISLRTSSLCASITFQNAASSNFSPVCSSIKAMVFFICASAYLSVFLSSQRIGTSAVMDGRLSLRSMSWLFIVEESQGILFAITQAPIFGKSSHTATPAALFDRRQESAGRPTCSIASI